MFNLKLASEGVRKAAAQVGIKSGKFELVTDNGNQTDTAVIAKVYNCNFPNGIEILAGEAEDALNFTWEEINLSW